MKWYTTSARSGAGTERRADTIATGDVDQLVVLDDRVGGQRSAQCRDPLDVIDQFQLGDAQLLALDADTPRIRQPGELHLRILTALAAFMHARLRGRVPRPGPACPHAVRGASMRPLGRRRVNMSTTDPEMVLGHFIVSNDVERSRRFYTEVLGGTTVISGESGDDVAYVALANSWIIINVGGGPTDDKPTVTLETPPEPDRVSSFLNIRVADIQAVYSEWSARRRAVPDTAETARHRIAAVTSAIPTAI